MSSRTRRRRSKLEMRLAAVAEQDEPLTLSDFTESVLRFGLSRMTVEPEAWRPEKLALLIDSIAELEAARNAAKSNGGGIEELAAELDSFIRAA